LRAARRAEEGHARAAAEAARERVHVEERERGQRALESCERRLAAAAEGRQEAVEEGAETRVATQRLRAELGAAASVASFEAGLRFTCVASVLVEKY
jgi:hypothetical protein